ncbi:hypothetical protein AAFF_G00203950 [Aldrovandia affinis]|uniref:Uncharacterized protein n=1 Tax=Aldrovandia affinis TaxID=143900 RepID=A0AAD7WW38_9TELE|nr:hypothetical protein AAFF_G00203950 [Aldrovandia affinis]
MLRTVGVRSLQKLSGPFAACHCPLPPFPVRPAGLEHRCCCSALSVDQKHSVLAVWSSCPARSVGHRALARLPFLFLASAGKLNAKREIERVVFHT